MKGKGGGWIARILGCTDPRMRVGILQLSNSSKLHLIDAKLQVLEFNIMLGGVL